MTSNIADIMKEALHACSVKVLVRCARQQPL